MSFESCLFVNCQRKDFADAHKAASWRKNSVPIHVPFDKYAAILPPKRIKTGHRIGLMAGSRSDRGRLLFGVEACD